MDVFPPTPGGGDNRNKLNEYILTFIEVVNYIKK